MTNFENIKEMPINIFAKWLDEHLAFKDMYTVICEIAAVWNKEEYRTKQIERMTGDNNPFYGKTHTEETKQLLRERRKEMWQNEEYRKNIQEKMLPIMVRREERVNVQKGLYDYLIIRYMIVAQMEPKTII